MARRVEVDDFNGIDVGFKRWPRHVGHRRGIPRASGRAFAAARPRRARQRHENRGQLRRHRTYARHRSGRASRAGAAAGRGVWDRRAHGCRSSQRQPGSTLPVRHPFRRRGWLTGSWGWRGEGVLIAHVSAVYAGARPDIRHRPPRALPPRRSPAEPGAGGSGERAPEPARGWGDPVRGMAARHTRGSRPPGTVLTHSSTSTARRRGREPRRPTRPARRNGGRYCPETPGACRS